MIQTISQSTFIDSLRNVGRQDQFSYNALEALYKYFIGYEEDSNTQIELDPIAICCEYCEYDSAWDAMYEYQPEDMPTEGEEGDDLEEIQEKNEEAALGWLNDHTQVIEFKGGIVIQSF